MSRTTFHVRSFSLKLKHLIFQADIFGAGTDTTLSSILWNILFLAAISGQINPEVTEGQLEEKSTTGQINPKATKGQIKTKAKRGQNNLEATEGHINPEAKGQMQAEATKGQIKEECSKEVRNSQTSRDAVCDQTSKFKNRFSQHTIRRKLLDDNVIDIAGRLFRYEMYILASVFSKQVI